jgi:glycine cleavage system H protein
MEMEFPKDLRYTKDHEWARKNDDGTVTVGITAFAVEQLGDITLVDLHEVGTEIGVGDAFGTIESVKSVSDLYSPVKGKVAAINEALEDQPELVNQACYADGWLTCFETEGKELDALLDAESYATLVAEES